jgi:hypothetical protein
LSVIAGVIAFVVPGITALFLLGLIAGRAIITGVLEVIAAIQIRKYVTGEWLMVLSGIASVLFGALLLINPRAGALAVEYWLRNQRLTKLWRNASTSIASSAQLFSISRSFRFQLCCSSSHR